MDRDTMSSHLRHWSCADRADRISRGGKFWMKITDDQDAVVRNQIRFGVRLEWRERALDPLHLPNQPSAFKHTDFVTIDIETLLACGAVTKTDRPPTCVFPLGVVPKPLSNKLRLILDHRGRQVRGSRLPASF
jgi:hypothetical protein